MPGSLLKQKAFDAFSLHAEAPVGVGAFSRVIRGDDRSGSAWALKMIPIESVKDVPACCFREIAMQERLSGEPSAVQLQDAFSTQVCYRGRTMDFVVLQMPLMACNLMQHICHGKETIWGSVKLQARELLSAARIQSLLIQMANAVRKCHQHGVVHRDVKLENWLLDSSHRVLLCDFGLAAASASGDAARQQLTGASLAAGSGRPVGEESLQGCMQQGGTCWTMSPGRLAGRDEGEAADWWALGVVLYQLHLGGAWAFKQQWSDAERRTPQAVNAAVERAIVAGRVVNMAEFSREVRDVIHGLLQADPAKRWGLPQLLASSYLSDPHCFSRVAREHAVLAADMAELQAWRDCLLLETCHKGYGASAPCLEAGGSEAMSHNIKCENARLASSSRTSSPRAYPAAPEPSPTEAVPSLTVGAVGGGRGKREVARIPACDLDALERLTVGADSSSATVAPAACSNPLFSAARNSNFGRRSVAAGKAMHASQQQQQLLAAGACCVQEQVPPVKTAPGRVWSDLCSSLLPCFKARPVLNDEQYQRM